MRARRLPSAAPGPLLLAAGAFGLAFLQRPGWATADTKINLHLDPAAFLGQVARMWTATGQLGDVQAAQQVGYLFPMGPFFAAGHALGLPDWVVQRLWLGALLALAACGVVRLLNELWPGPRGAAAFVAGSVAVLNPFVVTYTDRTTVTLLAYAALPWLLVAVHRGLRQPRGWSSPAAAALIVTASGGGVNGAVTAWMLLGPGLLILYERWLGEIPRAAVAGFLGRAVGLTALLSLWWVIPAYLQAKYGANFLQFTEQPGTVWGTTSATEALRLMSFWLSYVGIGFAGRAIPYFDTSPTMLFSVPVVLATLLLPAGALGSFLAARRWRYGPFFLGLALIGVVVMMAGFPEGTVLRHGLTFTYNRVAAVRFLRASYKAAPLVAIAYAALAGVGVEALWRSVARRRSPRVWRAGLGAGVGAALVLAAWPLVTGRAQDRQVSFRSVPAAWRTAARDLDRGLRSGSRALVLPGELFSFYTWGGTVDPILPALSTRPVAMRTEVPYGDLRATDLLWTIDGLVHQGRLLPGQLAPLARLIGAGAVITGTDADLGRSDAPAPGAVAATLAAQPGFAAPARSYGPVRRFAGADPGPPVALAEVRRYDVGAARPRVRIEGDAPTVVDGSAAALAGLAAFGALPSRAPLLYSGDLAPPALRRMMVGGGRLVISDANRRRAFAAATLEQDTGPTLAAVQGVSADGLILDPFGRGPEAETVARYGGGISLVHAPASPQRPQFPEHRPFAALDGKPATAWLADPTLDPGRRWLEVDFPAPRAVRTIGLLPYGDAGGTVSAVSVNGRQFVLRAGWNRLPLGLPAVRAVRIAITRMSPPAPGVTPGVGGIRELQIPGVRASETLRTPLDAATALARADLRRAELDIVLERTAGDQPFRRNPPSGDSLDVRRPADPETTIDRTVTLPVARSFSAQAWVSSAAGTPDPALDRLAGIRTAVLATSSGRFAGEPRWRASAALDSDPSTAWVAVFDPAHLPWLAWRAPRPSHLTVLRLHPAALPVARPARVQISWPGGSTPGLPVAADGTVRLPRAVAARSFRLTVLADSGGRVVGIAGIDGAPRVPAVRSARMDAPCGTVRLVAAGRRVPLRVTGSAAAFGRGDPLPARACGPPVALPAGTAAIVSLPGPLLVDELLLRAPAPARPVITRRWLVLGESYNRGWTAACGSRAMGTPVPIDGYANGWLLSAPCPHPSFRFAPQRSADLGYIVSAITALACLLLLRRARPRREVSAALSAPSVPARLEPLRQVLVGAALSAVAAGIVFGAPAGVAALAVVGLVRRRGVGVAALTAGAAALLAIAVPLLYLAHPSSAAGGNHPGYAAAHSAASWAGVAAIGLLTLALWRSLVALRRAARAAPRAGSPRA